MKILITGGLGYVGGRLVEYFQNKRPEQALILTTTRNNFPSWAKENNVVFMDLAKQESIAHCLQNTQPDIVIHLAAMPQKQCELDSEKALAVNAEGTRHILEMADQTGVKRFIYFSTFQVYGQLKGEISEENSPNPKNIYAESKLKAENIICEFVSKQKMQKLIFRLSNGFGYPQDENVGENIWGLAFNAFCRRCFADGVISIDSNQYRDFITLEDVTRAVDHLLFLKPNDWRDGLFNLGGNCCLSILEVAKRVSQVYAKYYQRSLEIKTLHDHFERFHYCVDKLQSTGFEWKGNSEEEILKTLQLCERLYMTT